MKLPRITEAEFTKQVLALAKLRGWRSAHFRPGRTATGWRTAVQGDGIGFPDLILVRGKVMIAAELKVGRNQPRPEQWAWLQAFSHISGVIACFWTPAMWTQIEEALL